MHLLENMIQKVGTDLGVRGRISRCPYAVGHCDTL